MLRGASLRTGEIMTQKMSQSILAECIKRGFGIGRMFDYKPWLRIRRRMSSPISKQVFCNLTLRPTNHHLLSGLEYKTGLLNSWLGPYELRESFPLWPKSHSHPQAGLQSDKNLKLDESPGLLDIAKSAGIDHGFFPGTKVHYVATNDLLFWVPSKLSPLQQLVFISCKPKNEIATKQRVRERLELERRYAMSNGGLHHVETGEYLPTKLIDNLDWILPLRSEVQTVGRSAKHADFCALLMELAKQVPLGQAIDQARTIFRLTTADGFQYFRVGVWQHKVDIDLNFPVVMTRPMKLDGGKTLTFWRSHYWYPKGVQS